MELIPGSVQGNGAQQLEALRGQPANLYTPSYGQGQQGNSGGFFKNLFSGIGSALTSGGLGSVLGGASSLIGTVGSLFTRNSDRKFQVRMMKAQQEYNSSEAEKAYERQLDFFNKQNEYNSPSNQRKLLADAGYNPNIAYSGAAGTAASSGSSNPAQASSSAMPSGSAINPFDKISEFGNLVSVMSQAKLNQSQARLIDSQVRNLDSRTDYQNIENALFRDLGRAEKVLHMNESEARATLFGAQAFAAKVTGELGNFDLTYIKPQIYAKTAAEVLLTEANTKLAEIQGRATEEQVKQGYLRLKMDLGVALAKIGMMREQTNYYRSMAERNDTMTSLYKGNGLGLQLMQSDINRNNSISKNNFWDSAQKAQEFSIKEQFKNEMVNALKAEWIKRGHDASFFDDDFYRCLEYADKAINTGKNAQDLYLNPMDHATGWFGNIMGGLK